jgi:hypothetical protein
MFYESAFTPEDWEVFAEYGRTMLSAQELEASLIAHVSTDDYFPNQREGASAEVWREEVMGALARLFHMTAGQLKKKLLILQDVPEEMVEELGTAIDRRNKLVHGYLSTYMMERHRGLVTFQTAVSDLRDMRTTFEDIDVRLSAWMRETEDRKLRERGEDPEEYRARMREEARERLRRIRADREAREGTQERPCGAGGGGS